MKKIISFFKNLFKVINELFSFGPTITERDYAEALKNGYIKQKPFDYINRVTEFKKELNKLNKDDNLGKLMVIKNMEPKFESSAEEIEFSISYGWYETEESKNLRLYIESLNLLKSNEVIVRKYKNIYLEEIQELMKKINFSQEELKQ